MFISRPTKPSRKPKPASARGSAFTTTNARTKRWIISPRANFLRRRKPVDMWTTQVRCPHPHRPNNNYNKMEIHMKKKTCYASLTPHALCAWRPVTHRAGISLKLPKSCLTLRGHRNGVTAPFVLDGPMDGPHFLAYVEQILAPTLKKGQIVFLDNVSTHKVDGVEEAIEARGARAVFLPAYSPDLNPIEQLFARLKSFLRKMKARTVETLWRAISSFLKEVSKDECKAYLANAGYA